MSLSAGAQQTHAALAHISSGWAAQNSWTILDTGFGSGLTFLELWQHWRSHASRPAMLHVAALLSASDAAALATALGQHAADTACTADTRALADSLSAQCYGLLPGFHRILLADGHLSLTLCVGEVSALLAQQELQADTVLARVAAQPWDKWALKALARCCKRGTALAFDAPAWPEPALLLDAGFQVAPDSSPTTLHALYDPRWQLRASRRSQPAAMRPPGRCAVVGAGIAGASVARALAVRGWQVDVYDTHAAPAGGAAGLPVGLVVPHHSADDSPRSRMSRAGTRLTLQHASQLLRIGADWQPGGVLELELAETGLAEAEAEVLSHSVPALAPTGWASRAQWDGVPGLWHPHAAWIKPARLVQQWLAHPGIRFHGATTVHTLRRAEPHWILQDAQGRAVASADLVVFANAHAAVDLLQRIKLPAGFAWLPEALHALQLLQALPGTLSMGLCPNEPEASASAAAAAAQLATASPVFPPFPTNGHGSLVSGVPTALGRQWYAGSTFQTDPGLHADLAREHASNFHKLQALLPKVADLLAPQFNSHQVQAWQGTRCVSHDRLPLVGPLDAGPAPSLWLSAAMGARGLSFSALCAELLVATLGGEPLPVETSLARALSTRRTLRKQKLPA